MKIRQFDGGGQLGFTPMVAPAATTASASASVPASKPSSALIEDNDYIKLAGKGLTNDVNQWVDSLIQLESSATNPFANPNTGVASLRKFTQLNEIMMNKELWTNAITQAKSEGGLSEVAIGNSGEVYTRGADYKIKAISLQDYKKNRNSMRLMTVAEVLQARQNEAQLAGQNGVLSVADNAIGLNKITDHINNIIAAFGTETVTDFKTYSKEQILDQLGKLAGKKPTSEEAQAVQTLQNLANTPGEIIKLETINSSERNQALKAVDYIWKTLGDAAQKKMLAVAAVNGIENPKELIFSMINNQTNASITEKITSTNSSGSSDDSGSSSGSSTGEKSLTAFQLFHKDKLRSPNLEFQFNDPVYGTLFNGSVGGVSPIITPDGNNVGMTTLRNVLDNGYNQFLNSSNIHFGNKLVSPIELNNIIYDGQDAAKVYMPVGKDGGPDYEAFKEFKELYAEFEANKDSWSTQQAERHFEEKGYKLKIDTRYEGGKQTKVIRDNAYVKPFLVMYGYTNDATSLVDNNKDWLVQLNSSDESIIVPQLEQVWTTTKGKKSTNLTPKSFWSSEDYYKGMIAIPYRDNATAIIDTMVGQGPKEKVSSYSDVQRNILNSSNKPLNDDISAKKLINT